MSRWRRRQTYRRETALQVAQEKVQAGSTSDLARREGISIVDAAMNADALVLVDSSSSMNTALITGESAHDRADQELGRLQQEFYGKVAVFSFSSDVAFCPTGTAIRFNGLTAMAKALDYVLRFDGLLKIYLLSDGYPTPSNPIGMAAYITSENAVEEEVLASAAKFRSPINTIFIGDEIDKKAQEFLRKLAAATGGRYVMADEIAKLYDPTKRLFLSDGITAGG